MPPPVPAVAVAMPLGGLASPCAPEERRRLRRPGRESDEEWREGDCFALALPAERAAVDVLVVCGGTPVVGEGGDGTGNCVP